MEHNESKNLGGDHKTSQSNLYPHVIVPASIRAFQQNCFMICCLSISIQTFFIVVELLATLLDLIGNQEKEKYSGNYYHCDSHF